LEEMFLIGEDGHAHNSSQNSAFLVKHEETQCGAEAARDTREVPNAAGECRE